MDTKRKNLILLDLEETVIDNWDNGCILRGKVSKIKDFLSNFDPSDTELGLMSWAVWDDRDVKAFDKRFLTDILTALDWPEFNHTWSMDDWNKMIGRCSCKHYSKQDMFDMFTKEHVLLILAMKHERFKNCNIYLIDDTVPHGLQYDNPTWNNRVTFHDIAKM